MLATNSRASVRKQQAMSLGSIELCEKSQHENRKRPKQSLSETVINQAKAKFMIDCRENVILEKVSRKEVLEFFENRKVGFRYSFIPEQLESFESESYGRLIILELTKFIHESVAILLNSIVTESVGGHRNVCSIGSGDCLIGGIVKKPDGGIHPFGLRPDNFACFICHSRWESIP
jgi:hypothetical protein